MKLKINWGTGIVIAMIIMVSGMLALVSVAIRQDFDLVDNDYYQKSINYQQHIEKVRNNEALPEKIRVELSGGSLHVNFPALGGYQDFSGEIHFYSPVEQKRDLIIPVQPESSLVQVIDLENLEKGRYQIKIDWKVKGTGYYQEEEITVER
jgi:hypothetical protein